MARHRKPAVIRQLEGNRGKRPIPNEIAGRGKPRCPDDLSDDQKRCWQAVVRSVPEGILTSADNQVLERMAIAWALHREAARLIREGAVLVKGHDSRPTKNPALTIMRQASQEMELCGTALGLTPYARTRLQAPEAEDDDPLALLLGEPGRSWMTETTRHQ
jgi:P27 family predicted phage terminase small subunit